MSSKKQGSQKPEELDDIPPMSLMQKVIIGVAVVAFVAVVAYLAMA